MGAANSKIEEDKALLLCRERKKFVRQALDGRCSLAAAHMAYINSLKLTATALRKFLAPEAPIESSLYTSTTATPEPLGLTEKSLSQFSFSSPTLSQPVEATENLSPSPSPPSSSRFQANHMRFRGFSSSKVEEKPPLPVTGTVTVTSSSTPENVTPHSTGKRETSPFEGSSNTSGTPPWDYFGFFHPIDHQFSFQEGTGMNQGFENLDHIRQLRGEEGIPGLEDEDEKASSHEREESQDSEDEFDEPPTDTLVQRFENLNRIHDHGVSSASPAMPSAATVASESKLLNEEKSNSPDLSPLRTPSLHDHGVSSASPAMPSAATVASESKLLNEEKSNSPYLSPLRTPSSAVTNPTDIKETPVKEDGAANKVSPKNFLSSMKDIEYLFIKASDSGKEVPRMLEANKLHFRPIVPSKESGSVSSTIFKACFSCGEEPSQVQEVPPQAAVKYLTWHRTTSSRSSSSHNPLGLNANDDSEDLAGNLFDNFCMISGSHASTLDRLYAWERKLYDEVKACEMIRRVYDSKCKILRQLESNGENSTKIDKTRAIVKDLHSRIRVAIYRIDSISKRIEELRDKELQPQLEELIKGLSRMWEVMLECHKLQFQIISVAYNSGNYKIPLQSESHRHIASNLVNELSYLSSSFTKWIGSQKSYLQSINNWLLKCVSIPQKSSRRKRKPQAPNLTKLGPPIYVTCGDWMNKLDDLPAKDVVESIKCLAADANHFLPRPEKNQGKRDNGSESAVNLLRDEASDDWISGLDRFRSSLKLFLGKLNNFADSSAKLYTELQISIEDVKTHYERWKSQVEAYESERKKTDTEKAGIA